MSTRLIRKLIGCVIIAAGVIYLALVFGGDEPARRDFISYWAAGQLLRAHENPYGHAETLRIERSAGFAGAEPLIQRMPPTSLPLLLPLGFLDARVGAIVWSLLIIGILVLGVQWSREPGKASNGLHLLGYVFAPALACILAGQTGVFLLAGVALFFRFHSSRPFAAGVALSLLSLKPHLFLAFGVGLIVWIAVQRRYRVFAGMLAGMSFLMVASFWIAPRGWPQYLSMIAAARIGEEALPNVSLLFRIALDRNAVWLQMLPAIAAALWAAWYSKRNACDWDWTSHGSVVLLVSVLAAPYSWFTDQALLLPPMLHALYSAERRGVSLTWHMAFSGCATLLVLAGAPLYSMWYVWTPLAWLGCWLQLEGVPSSRASMARASVRA